MFIIGGTMKRMFMYILFFVFNITNSMQLTVKETDIPDRSHRLTNKGLIQITKDIVQLSHTNMSMIEDKVIKNLDNLKESQDTRVQDMVDRFRTIARLYSSHEPSEARNIVLEDREMVSYINSIVVKSMDEYLQEKDLTIEDLQKQAKLQRIQKYLAFAGSGCLTIVSIIIPLVVAVLECT